MNPWYLATFGLLCMFGPAWHFMRKHNGDPETWIFNLDLKQFQLLRFGVLSGVFFITLALIVGASP